MSRPYCEKVYEFLKKVSPSSSKHSLPSKEELDKAFLSSFKNHAEADFREVFCSPPNLAQLTPIHPSMVWLELWNFDLQTRQMSERIVCVDLSQKTRESLAGMNSPYPSMTSLFGSPSRTHMTPSSPFMGFPGLNFVFCYIYISGLRKKRRAWIPKILISRKLTVLFFPPFFLSSSSCDTKGL